MSLMRTTLRVWTLVFACGGVGAAQVQAPSDGLQSPALALELLSVMAHHNLDAIAAPDPDAADSFIAILAFPKVQLLAVGARPPSAEYVTWQIGQKQYRQAYEQLQQAGLSEHRVFFQDMGANGLPTLESDTADVMYQRGVQVIFDPSAKRRGQDLIAYRNSLEATDKIYSRMLRLAIAAARAHSVLKTNPGFGEGASLAERSVRRKTAL